MEEKFMRRALEKACESKEEVPVGAVIVHKGAIIAEAHNERETTGSPFAHAEILAMEKAAQKLGKRRLNDCELYVTLEPCPMCAGAMVMAQLGTCFFGAFDESQGCCGSVYMIPEDQAFYHRVKCVGGILEKECAEILKNFFNEKR